MSFRKYVRTKFGIFMMECENGALTAVKSVSAIQEESTCPMLEKAAKALLNYEKGIASKDTVVLSPACTPFQLAVYKEVTKIPFGETSSYGEIAERIGRKGAARAVGNALNKNPLWIFIPCHRVIGKNQALTGFAGGLEMKKMLLEHERNYFMNSSAICTAFVAAPFLT